MKRILFIALLLVPLFLHSQEKTETKIDDTYFGLRFGNAYSEKEIRSQMEQEGEHNTSRVSVPISSFMFSQVKFLDTSWTIVEFSTKTRYKEIPGILYEVAFMSIHETEAKRDSVFNQLEKSIISKHGDGFSSTSGKMIMWFDGDRTIVLLKMDPEKVGDKTCSIVLEVSDNNIASQLTE